MLRVHMDMVRHLKISLPVHYEKNLQEKNISNVEKGHGCILFVDDEK